MPDVDAVAGVRPAGERARSPGHRRRRRCSCTAATRCPTSSAVLGGAVAQAGERLRRLIERARRRARSPGGSGRRTRRPSRTPVPRSARTTRTSSPSVADQPRDTSTSARHTPCRSSTAADVGGATALLGPQALVLEDVQADAGHARRGGRGHPFVEAAEPRPAEVRPDQVARTRRSARPSHDFGVTAFWMRWWATFGPPIQPHSCGSASNTSPSRYTRRRRVNEPDPPVLGEHPDVAVAVLLVERPGERMAQAEHVSRPHPLGRAGRATSAPSIPGSWRASRRAWPSPRGPSGPSAC